MTRLLSLSLAALLTMTLVGQAAEPAKVAPGAQAPAFQIKTPAGKTIDLAELTANGPVLLRLTCGCSGCDKELAYFQAMNEAYKKNGLTMLAVFREPDAKVAAYAKEKKLSLFPRKTLTVLAGPPVDLSAFHDREPTPEVLKEATEVIMAAITGLLEELRGEQAPAQPYDHRRARAEQRRKAAGEGTK